MSDEVLATIHASAPRRGFGVVVLALLGAFVLYIALAYPAGELGWQVFLLIFGVVVLWFANKMWRATGQTIELTKDELRCDDRSVIARIDQIKSVDRGTFAFKPSNGFMLRLKEKAPNAWHPGLWWRIGRNVGVGGVTSAAQTKAVAEVISAMLVDEQR